MNGLRISEVLDVDVDALTTERGRRVLLITRKGGKKARPAIHHGNREGVATVRGVENPQEVGTGRCAGKGHDYPPSRPETRVRDVEPSRRCKF